MIAWVAARNDGDAYGGVRVYRFPRDTSIFGPVQIEARIDQDPVISSQVTLWNQSGSEVVRGNLIVIPVQDSIIYLEPIYLQSTGSAIPEFTKIVVASPTKVVWGDTLEEALNLLLAGGPAPTPTPSPSPGASPSPGRVADAVADVGPERDAAAGGRPGAHPATPTSTSRRPRRRSGEGDFATYGVEMAEVEKTLRSSRSWSGGAPPRRRERDRGRVPGRAGRGVPRRRPAGRRARVVACPRTGSSRSSTAARSGRPGPPAALAGLPAASRGGGAFAAATALTVRRPRLWVFALLAFLARGGLVGPRPPDRGRADVRRARQLRRPGLGLGGGSGSAARRPRRRRAWRRASPWPWSGPASRPRRRWRSTGPRSARARTAAALAVRGAGPTPRRGHGRSRRPAPGRGRGGPSGRPVRLLLLVPVAVVAAVAMPGLGRRRLPRADPAERRGRPPRGARPRRRAGRQRGGARGLAGGGGRGRLRGAARGAARGVDPARAGGRAPRPAPGPARHGPHRGGGPGRHGPGPRPGVVGGRGRVGRRPARPRRRDRRARRARGGAPARPRRGWPSSSSPRSRPPGGRRSSPWSSCAGVR